MPPNNASFISKRFSIRLEPLERLGTLAGFDLVPLSSAKKIVEKNGSRATRSKLCTFGLFDISILCVSSIGDFPCSVEKTDRRIFYLQAKMNFRRPFSLRI